MNYYLFNEAIFKLSNWSPDPARLLVGLVLMIGLGWIVYDLLTTGRKGKGWIVLLFLASVLAYMLRVAVSMFREVAGGAGSDWDG